MITVDSRAGSGELLPLFPQGTAALGHLEYGDASFVGKGPGDKPLLIGVERKTVSDLFDSFHSGRFQGHQLPGLVSSYNRVYLIIEGITRFYDERLQVYRGNAWHALGITEQGYDGLMNTLQNPAGLLLCQTANKQRTVRLILHLRHWWQKGWDEHRGHLGFSIDLPPTMQFRKPSLLRCVAKELPGIGWEKSKAVEEKFSSIVEMITATEEQWREIPGIGKRMASNIVQLLTGRKDG